VCYEVFGRRGGDGGWGVRNMVPELMRKWCAGAGGKKTQVHVALVSSAFAGHLPA